jgi:simple sugar transport system permease protein
VGAGLFFGASQVAALYANGIPFLKNAPRELFFMLPYVLTVLALILFSGKSVGPKASGEIYDQGKR